MEAEGKENQRKPFFLLKNLIYFWELVLAAPAEELYAAVGE